MCKFSSFIYILVLACSLYAETSVPVAESEGSADSVATLSVAADSSAMSNVASSETAATVSDSSVAVNEPAIAPASDSAAALESVADSAKDFTAAGESVSTVADSTSAKAGPTKIDPQKIARMFAPRKSEWPRFLAHGLYVRAGYGSPSSVDIDIGFMFPLSKSWNVSLGFDVIRTQLNFSDDFQTVSDETLFTLGAGLVLGGVASAFSPKPPASAEDDSTSAEKNMSTGMMALGFVALAPLYFYCGVLYLPIVPGDWLGIVDKSHLLTQIISEGFHKRSFTYINDVGLRLSPIASESGFVHGFVDGGIRFVKNFDSKLKYRYFAQAGIARSF